MKSKSIFVLLIVLCVASVFPKTGTDPWGGLKKIYFYDSLNRESKIAAELKNLNLDDVNRAERHEIAEHLVKFGDYYLSKDKQELAGAFYRKVINLSPEYWYLYNRLEKINRTKGSLIFDFKNVLDQLYRAVKDFKSSFILVNNFLNTLFFSAILSLFLFAFLLFIRYFKLGANDVLIDRKGRLPVKSMLILVAVLLWPIVIVSGWMTYPFLICGLLWIYVGSGEKKTLSFILISLLVVSLLYSLNLSFEKTVAGEKFKTVRQVVGGKLFEKEEYERFDDELKVHLAFSYYESEMYDKALDILDSTGEDYKSPLKYTMMGNIYFKSGDMAQSITCYKDSLNLDEHNPTTLNNFTLTLLRKNDPKVFDLWAKRYPAIAKYKNKKSPLVLEEVEKMPGILWQRLFNSSRENFDIKVFLSGLLGQFLRLPVVYMILIFVLYVSMIKRIYPNIGESTYCSKCSKIIKESSIHKSYKLCDECYQLFLIKDVIFLEAKVMKEKELNRRFRRRYNLVLLFSILIPGLNLNYRGKHFFFVLFSTIFYLLAGFALLGSLAFKHVFAASPMFLNVIGVGALLLYLFANTVSIIGDENGV